MRPWLRLAALALACIALGTALHWARGCALEPGGRPGPGLAAGGLCPPDSATAEPGAGAAAAAARVHLNRATQAELETLPGIGPALARRILEFRATHGPFRAAAELRLVRGIGPKKWAALSPRVAP
ncbi:MAG TPA: helix-hairpin-helix domain-containing protein [Candidatus Saccharimonadales bacterium]|nr:helix-hairpin-helix domain-containing protein [Candidatus Saccharimonadales bacterium]